MGGHGGTCYKIKRRDLESKQAKPRRGPHGERGWQHALVEVTLRQVLGLGPTFSFSPPADHCGILVYSQESMFNSCLTSEVYCCLITKLYQTLCSPMDCSPPGSSVHGISQARALEWVAAGVSFLLQGIFPTQELNPRLLHWQADCLPPNHRRSHKSLCKVKTLVTWSCPTLCDPMDCCPPNFPVHGILWAKILEWVAIPFSSGSFQPRDLT